MTNIKSETILLVEDDPAILDLLSEFLTTSGYVVVTAEDGRAALTALATDAAISWLITDVLMPGISGVELAHQAHARWPALRIVVVSGSWDSEQAPEGPWLFLAKPFRFGELLGLLQAAPAGLAA